VVVDTNEQLAAMYRTTRQQLIGRSFLELIAPASRPAVLAHLEQGLGGACQYQAIRADGTTFPVEARARNVVLDGRPLRVAAIRDMTEHVRAQAERERLMRELQARNAEMEQFTYTVSHDLKSPLVTISGFLGAIERDLREGSPARVASDIARIRSAASKMSALLEDLLKLSRVGRIGGPFEPLSIAELALEAAELVAGVLEAGHIQLDVADDHTLVYGDRGRLLQVFQNLIDNAAKYSAQRPHPRIEVGWRQEVGRCLVFVRDNGIGIVPEYAERIFGLFEKLDPKSPGTGIGLALVRRIVEFHGGRIWVESDGQSGSAFWFTLPRPATAPVPREEMVKQ
jgi:PAS domain S-box-containing protein